MLWRGSAFARILIRVIALVRLVGTTWIFASLDRAQWYEGIGSLVIYALVAGHLLFGDTARDYTDSRGRCGGGPRGPTRPDRGGSSHLPLEVRVRPLRGRRLRRRRARWAVVDDGV